MEYIPIRVYDLVRNANRDLYLPAIQRELVWGTDRIERLFDSIMCDYPIGSFLYWRVDNEHKGDWPIYEFVRDFDTDNPHNDLANLAGVTRDINLVLDGQQRITSLIIGLKGSYRYFYYRSRHVRLYLNLLKEPVPDDDNPEELTYEFAFRESDAPDEDEPQLWYLAGNILDHPDAEDAKAAMRKQLSILTEAQRENANRLIGRLHSRIHTITVANYYVETSQDYEKVLQVFVRANSGGQPLEYSDILLATATAKWESLDARKEINDFTDDLNDIGNGYKFGKDFVLKACLYLSEDLPIQYKVKNFTRNNLRIIENNWEQIKTALSATVRLISRFGFTSKNIVAPLALLPIAFYLMKRGNAAFDSSSNIDDVQAQIDIRQWFIFATLKNAFGGSSDTTLTRLRDILKGIDKAGRYPASELYKGLGIEPEFREQEVTRLLELEYQGRYTNLVLSLLYPDRDWKDLVLHEDHIFPKSEFQVRALKKRGYNQTKIDSYVANFNTIANLQLLPDSENLTKNATPFDNWISTRDAGFKARHLIPPITNLNFDAFDQFVVERKALISAKLKSLGTKALET